MTDAIIVLVSSAPGQAQTLADSLLEEHLAACVSICSGVQSTYRWRGQICQDEECLLIIKSDRRLWLRLEQRVKALHKAEVPEIVMLKIEAGHVPYLHWLADAVMKPLAERGTSCEQ